jgi:phospholipid-binding lipoprotein MlaA
MRSRSSLLRRVLPVFLGALTCCLASAAAAEAYLTSEEFYAEETVNGPPASDPLEPVNRAVFRFNDFLYLRVLDPVATVYTKVTPDPLEKGLGNFFDNLEYPVRLAGNLLQGRWDGAWRETQRFAINTTVGLGGVLSPADSMDGFEAIPPEDVGQAFGSWGIGEGPYLVLPLFGPSNVRDLGGFIGDRAVHPLKEPFSLIDDWDWEWRTALWGTDLIQRSPDLIERYRQMKGGAIDPYVSLRNAYTQRRRAAVAD